MADKKETGIMIFAVIALVGCCLLLTMLFAGGGLAFLGGYLNNQWILGLGFAIIVVAIIAFVWNEKRNKK